jgi:hypothetical protein
MKGAAQYVPTPNARYLRGGREIKPFRCCIIAAQIVEIAALPHRSADRWARRARRQFNPFGCTAAGRPK